MGRRFRDPTDPRFEPFAKRILGRKPNEMLTRMLARNRDTAVRVITKGVQLDVDSAVRTVTSTLNYLKTKKDGSWAWPPMCFQNPVEKIEAMVAAMDELGIVGECECFDTGIVRSIAMYEAAGILRQPINISLVMGVASGMPAKASWLPLLIEEISEQTQWQTIAIGREDTVWPLLRKTAELGGNVRTGMEDTFYRLDGSRATESAMLVEDLVTVCREEGRTPATVEETRRIVLGEY